MRMRLAGFLAVILLAFSSAEGVDRQGPRQSFAVTRSERFSLEPGATIRFEHSYGYLTAEGWDEPEMEIVLTESADRFDWPDRKQRAEELFAQVQVVTEKRSPKELVITTTVPTRTSLLTSRLPSGKTIMTQPLPPNTKRGVTLEWKVRAPRRTSLVVHHDNGYVFVSGLTGDLDVNSHTGDMIVQLPDEGRYAIDAGTGMGRISSNFSCKSTLPRLVGGHLVCAAPPPAPRVHLRMGRGSITLQNGSM